MKKLQQRSVAALIDQYLEAGLSINEMTGLFRNSVMIHALSTTHGNVSDAAKLLQIHRNSVQRLMTKYHVHKETFHEVNGGLESQAERDEDSLESGRIAKPSVSARRSEAGTAKETHQRPERA